MTNTTLCLAMIIALTAEPLHNAAAGQGLAKRPVPRLASQSAVVIAVVDPFPYRDANAVVIRRHGAPDLIAIRSDRVDAARLARSVRLTQVLRAAGGTTGSRETITRVPESGGPTPLDAEAGDWVQYLQQTSERVVAGHGTLGRVRSVRLKLTNDGVHVVRVR
jgi:hypothetical protein